MIIHIEIRKRIYNQTVKRRVFNSFFGDKINNKSNESIFMHQPEQNR